MRSTKSKGRSHVRDRSQTFLGGQYTPGFPLKVEEHPIAHQISLIAYKVLSRLVLTIRPLVQHLS